MKRTTFSIPDKLLEKVKRKVKEGYISMNDYIVSLVREDTKDMVLPESPPVIKGGYYEAPNIPAEQLHDVGKWGTAIPSSNIPQPIKQSQTIPIEAPRRTPQTPPPQPLHPKVPPRNPNAPDPYLVYGGKCQYKNINAGNIMCMYSAARKLSVAQNQTGEQPDETQFQDVYLCPDHTSEVSHRSGFFVK